MEQPIFSLDIGTRTVIGLIAEGDDLSITAACTHEHVERSMADGQIHDVEKVASVVRDVKKELEEAIGHRLSKVAVAVAGRALLTSRGNVTVEMPFHEISRNDTIELELEAVTKARMDIGISEGFNCVGYSVVSYGLDGQSFLNPIDQKGRSLSVEVLATFLPEAVVNSMFAVLKKVELEAISLTLEPIAALNVAIPKDMRKLNLALVDIGAGTSDIAITADGTVVGYGMVPEAGDEITDIICDNYLVDFSKAEMIKRSLITENSVKIEDIFGQTTEVDTSEVIGVIEGKVDDLAKHIAEVILSINEKTPRAIICVGGGSQTVLIQERLAHYLDVNPRRVGIRLPEVIESIVDRTGKVTGAEMITPLGIVQTAHTGSGIEFMDVTVNDTDVQIMNINGLVVMDALVAAKIERVYGRLGRGLILTVNSSSLTVKGELGENARILLNGKEAHLGDTLHKGDRIKFEYPKDGTDAHILVSELGDRLDILPVDIILDGKQTRVEPHVTINGRSALGDQAIPDRADVIIRASSLSDLMDPGVEECGEIVVTVNRSIRHLTTTGKRVLINGTYIDSIDISNHDLKDGDRVQMTENDADLRIHDLIGCPENGKDMKVYVNDQEVIFSGKRGTVILNGKETSVSDSVHNGDVIITKNGIDADPKMSDVLEYIGIRREDIVGKIIRMYLDGAPAKFTTELTEGCSISIDLVTRGPGNGSE